MKTVGKDILGPRACRQCLRMYCKVKLTDLVKRVIFRFWLKKERWLNKQTTQSGTTLCCCIRQPTG